MTPRGCPPEPHRGAGPGGKNPNKTGSGEPLVSFMSEGTADKMKHTTGRELYLEMQRFSSDLLI